MNNLSEKTQIFDMNYYKPQKISNNITDMTSIRMALYKNVYSDISNINILMSLISSVIDTLLIEYNPVTNSINIKIKKTSMKKDQMFCHNTSYYYAIFTNIFSQYIISNIDLIKNDINYLDITDLQNPMQLSMVFNLTCVSDNIIIIYL